MDATKEGDVRANAACRMENSVLNGLTVDVEDYFHVEAFSDRIPQDSWTSFSPRVRDNTQRVLELFSEHAVRATFFVLGWVAERDPSLVRMIAEAGHELACHSFAHRRVDRLTPDEFRDDLRRARGAIEDAGSVKVLGYRAPTFSIRKRSLWALEILADEGFLYDSSIFPIYSDHYGYPDAPRFSFRAKLPSGRKLFEIPMSTVRAFGMNLPVGGGGYLRILPMFYTRWAVHHIQSNSQPVIVYFHPWELDPDQPRISGRWKSRLRHYLGLSHMERRLRELLALRRFVPLIDMVRHLESLDKMPDRALPAA